MRPARPNRERKITVNDVALAAVSGGFRALLLSRGDWSVFVTRPLSAGLLAAAALLLIIVLLPAVKNKRQEAFVEED